LRFAQYGFDPGDQVARAEMGFAQDLLERLYSVRGGDDGEAFVLQVACD
jgi:hypothetical protein